MKIPREVARRFTRSLLKLIMGIKIIQREDLRNEIAKQKKKSGSNSEAKEKKSTTTITLLVVQTCSLTYTELGGKASPNFSSNADSRVAGHRETIGSTTTNAYKAPRFKNKETWYRHSAR